MLVAVNQRAGVYESERGVHPRGERAPRRVPSRCPVLAQLAEAEAELCAIDGLQSGRVRLGWFASATGLAGRALRRFRERYPAVQVTVVEREATDSLAQLQRGDLDLALVYSYDCSPLNGVQAVEIRDLMRDPALVALPRAHPLAGKTAIPLPAPPTSAGSLRAAPPPASGSSRERAGKPASSPTWRSPAAAITGSSRRSWQPGWEWHSSRATRPPLLHAEEALRVSRVDGGQLRL